MFLLSQRLLNGGVSVVYSVCECNVLMSTLVCMTYEYLIMWNRDMATGAGEQIPRDSQKRQVY